MISESGQLPSEYPSLLSAYCAFDPDQTTLPAVALRMDFAGVGAEMPVHHHRKGQLVLALRGAITSRVPGAWWLVPPDCGVWLPGGTDHSNHATPNARMACLFIEPGLADLPKTCCTFAISPMLREMILHLAETPVFYAPGSHRERLARLVIDELTLMPTEQLHLPISAHPKLGQMAEALMADPADRRTLPQWAEGLALSERSLSRLLLKETGLSFGRWRQQLHLLVALRELSAGHSVQQVAGDLGYDSVTAFITMFRKSMGQSPARYVRKGMARFEDQAALAP